MNPLQVREKSLADTIGHLAGVISSDRFPTGERAALRRMTPGQLIPLAFYRFALRHLPEWWDYSHDSRKDWTTLVAGIAIMSPNAHRPERRFGTALAEAGYAESRLERLLSAEGDVRRILLLRTARFLAAKTMACNWVEGAQLLLTRDVVKRENVHRRIAKDFYYAIEN